MMTDPLIGETTDVYFSKRVTANEASAWEKGWVLEQAESNFTTEPFLDRWVGKSPASLTMFLYPSDLLGVIWQFCLSPIEMKAFPLISATRSKQKIIASARHREKKIKDKG